jgi:predicted dehydrogenase
MVGAALIGGSGLWGVRLAEAAARTASLRLVTCFNRDRDRRERFASEHRLEPAASFEAAIEHSDVEAVLLATPNDVHEEQALACADRGRHVLVEKPIADSLEAAARMRDRFAETGLVLAVGHELRRLGAARRVKQLLDEGALGTVLLAEANWSMPSKLTPAAWRWYRERAPGGPLLQLGIHHADTLAHWLGPVAESSGVFARLVTDAEIDDVGVVSLRFEAGAVGAITGSYVSPRTYFLRLYGDRGVLRYELDLSVWPHAERADAATTLTLHTGDGVETLDFEHRDPVAEELEELAGAVRGEATFETGADEGMAALRVILDAVPAEAVR